MISLSHPACEVMETGVPLLALTEPIARARQVVSGSKFRAACVVRPDGMLAGVLTRTTLLDDVRRSVILLDHNEASQAVDGIGEAEIVEIIDHHRLSPITTLKPVKFLNDPVGATSTIIAMKYAESGLVPSRGTAGALLCGILSDTLALRMSTTTHRDRMAVKFLVPLAGVDPEELGAVLLERGMDLAGVPLAAILSRDTKEFGLSKKKVITRGVDDLAPARRAAACQRAARLDGAQDILVAVLADPAVQLVPAVVGHQHQGPGFRDQEIARVTGQALEHALKQGGVGNA